MKDYELLDLIGDANEEHVLAAAEDGPARPRWRPWVGLAACAALALCAWPIYRIAVTGGTSALESYTSGAIFPGDTSDSAPALNGEDSGSAMDLDDGAPLALHAYTVVGDGGGVYEALTTAGGALDSTGVTENSAPEADAESAYDEEYEERGEDVVITAFTADKGDVYDDAVTEPEAPGAPVPAPEKISLPPVDQDAAIMQYQRLYDACGLEGSPPEWYAGAWLDNDYPDHVARLAVSIAAGYHTPELEARIEDWCGGQVVFVQDMKYAYARLKDMLDQVNRAWLDPGQREVWDGFNTMSIRIMDNCLEITFCGLPSDEALEFLARLDPEGDAIQVLAFTDPIVLADDELFGEEDDAVYGMDG